MHRPEVQERWPEVSGLTAWPPEWPSHGIGTTLIRAAEAPAAQCGHRRIGLFLVRVAL